MTKDEQTKFVEDMLSGFEKEIGEDFFCGRIPSYWTGKELRLFLAYKAKLNFGWKVSRQESIAFKNDILINGL